MTNPRYAESYVVNSFNQKNNNHVKTKQGFHKNNGSERTKAKECLITVRVCGREISALIDTGATHSMMGQGLLNAVPELGQHIQPLENKVVATAINGTKVCYDGIINLEVSIEDEVYTVPALYSTKIGYDLVLGYDFIRRNNIMFDFRKHPKLLKQCQVCTASDITLPPNSESTIWGTVDKLQSGNAMVSNSEVAPQLDLFVASTIVEITDSTTKVPVRVLNPSPISKTVRKSTKIAQLRLLDDDENLHPVGNKPRAHVPSNVSVPLWFEKMFDLRSSTFSPEQKRKLLDLLWDYQDIFSYPGKYLDCTDLVEFEIKLKPDARPFKARPYRSNPHVRREVRRQVEDMLQNDIIEPSTSQFGSPVLLVTKPDGTYRFCIDYRKLNAMTEIDCHPIARTDDCLESLGASGAKYFSSLDLQSGYWQLPVHKDSRQYTAFVTHDGLYQCKRMSFGLVNAPSVFSRLMSRVLQGLTWEVCLVYLDDVIVFSSTFEEHLNRLQLVFERFREAKLTCKPSKAMLGRQRIKFLGHYVSSKGIEPMPEKCQAVQDFPTPQKVKDIRSFLGLAGYYRKFIKDFSKIAGPLIDMTKKYERFIWSEECEKAFVTLKQKLISPPILAYPDFNKPYILQTDASDECVGMVLAQIQDGQERVIAYAGKRLSPNEKNYSVTEKEALAVIQGLKHFDPYLRGNQVSIVTDHSALVWLLSQNEPKGRIARWIAYIQQFNYTVQHKSGQKHSNADGLSRRSYPDETQSDQLVTDEEILPPLTCEYNSTTPKVNASRKVRQTIKSKKAKPKPRPVYTYPDLDWSVERLQECQRRDRDVMEMIEYLQQGKLPADDKRAREVLLTNDNYVLENDILYRLLDTKKLEVSKQVHDVRVCLIIPKELRHDVLTAAHGDLGAGHYGTQRTYTTLRLKYFWKGMYNDCKNWVLSCEPCNTRKQPVRPTRAELHPLKPVMTNERWAMDIVMLPLTPRGNHYILTFTEYNTRYVEAFALPNTQAVTIARILVDEICFRYGAPQELLSDLGANLTSHVVAKTCEMFNIHRITTTAYRPQTDGLIEKYHSTMMKNLSMYVNDGHTDWDLFLKGVCYSYNTSTCIDSTQFSPFYLMFGREPLDPLDTVLPQSKDVKEGLGETILKLQAARTIARNNVAERQDKMKERYDKSAFPRDFKTGDRVWIYFPQVLVGGTRKFFKNWSGPYILLDQPSPLNFRVAHAHNNEALKNLVHVNRLKPFYYRSVKPPLPESVSNEVADIADLSPDDAKRLQLANTAPPAAQPVDNQTLVPTPPIQTTTSLPIKTFMEISAQVPGAPADVLSAESPGVSPISIVPQAITAPQEEAVVATPRKEALLPPVVDENQDDVFVVNKIIKARYNKEGNKEFLIDWKGYPASERTYEPLENLNDAAKEYVETHNIPVVGKRPSENTHKEDA